MKQITTEFVDYVNSIPDSKKRKDDCFWVNNDLSLYDAAICFVMVNEHMTEIPQLDDGLRALMTRYCGRMFYYNDALEQAKETKIRKIRSGVKFFH